MNQTLPMQSQTPSLSRIDERRHTEPWAGRAGQTTLDRLVAMVGPVALEVLEAPGGLERPVRDVLILDPFDDPAGAHQALLLAVALDPAGAEAGRGGEGCARLGAAGVGGEARGGAPPPPPAAAPRARPPRPPPPPA